MTSIKSLLSLIAIVVSLCACQSGETSETSTSAHPNAQSQGLPSSISHRVETNETNKAAMSQFSDFSQIWSGSASAVEPTSTDRQDLHKSHEFQRLQSYIAAANYNAAMRYASTTEMRNLIQLEIAAHEEMLQVEAITAKADQESKNIKEL